MGHLRKVGETIVMGQKKSFQQRIVIEPNAINGGVYVILNPITKKVYIGETVDFGRRICEHIRSIFGYEYTSNENLCKEEQKTFLMFVVKEVDYDKNQDENKPWIVDETIYMYLFRKYGFELYNGNKDNKDNIGSNRDFLFGDHDIEDLWDKTKEFLCDNVQTLSYDDKQGEYWDNYMNQEDGNLQNQIETKFKIQLETLASPNTEADNLTWLEELEKENFIWVNPIGMNKTKVNSICKELRSLSKKNLEAWGLKEKSLSKLVTEGKLEKIVVTTYGGYLCQSPMTILRTKIFDLKHNKLQENGKLEIVKKVRDKDKGICFWSVGGRETEKIRTYLSENEDGAKKQDRQPRYMLMFYTDSSAQVKKEDQKLWEKMNPHDGETYEDFWQRLKNEDHSEMSGFAKSYALSHEILEKKQEEIYLYPFNTEKGLMFPEIIKENRKSIAFLISELYYVKEEFDTTEFKGLYSRYHQTLGEEENTFNEMPKQAPFACGRLTDKEKLKNVLEPKAGKVVDSAGCLIAKLEYPYVVAISTSER